jgi:hypothetical protein
MALRGGRKLALQLEQDKVLRVCSDLRGSEKLETCTWIERETRRVGGGRVHELDLRWRMIEEAPG